MAKHFFTDFDAEAYKVDGFTDEIVTLEPDITKKKLNSYMEEGISKIKRYKDDFEANANSRDTLNPYTMIRHCLYLGNREAFNSVLTNASKESFDKWLGENDG